MQLDMFPAFSVSLSKARTLSVCPRRYAMSTYEAWRGWESDATERQRLSYALGKLTTASAVLGEATHLEARRCAELARSGERLPSAAEVEERLEAAVEEVASARDLFAFWKNPKQNRLLRSTYYDGSPSPREIAATRQKIPRIAHNLVRCDLWPDLAQMDDYELVLEELGTFEIDGVPVWAKADLIAIKQDRHDEALLIDYKTSAGPMEGTDLQLAVYALYARDTLGVEFDPDRWRACAINFYTGSIRQVGLSHDSLEEATDWIRLQIRRMRHYQSNKEVNAPVPLAAFPGTEHLNECAFSCPFLEHCSRRFGLRVPLEE